jgi:hypothetical protein
VHSTHRKEKEDQLASFKLTAPSRRSLRFRLLPITLLILFGLAAAVAQAAPPGQTPTPVQGTPTPVQGTITGQVKNGTTGQLVADVEVHLRRWQADAELPSLAAKADAGGNFRFEGLDTGDQIFYRAEVVYNDVLFPGKFASFEPGMTQLSLPLDVYETTSEDTAITIDRFHFIIMSDQPGTFAVLELYQFSNQGNRAYVGSLDKDGLRETVRVALPEGAQSLALQGGTLGVDFLQTDGSLVATSPVVPGMDTFDMAFMYAVPYTGSSLSLNRSLYYTTTSVNGLLLDAGEKLTSEALTLVGPRAVQDQTYLQYTAQNLKAGAMLPLQLDDLDKMKAASPAGSDTSDNPAAALPSGGDLSQTALLWLILALGGIALVLGLAYPRLRLRLRGEVAPVQVGDPAQDRQRLLLTLARLDQAYQAGRLNETVYRRVRARRKAELIELMRRGERS